MPNVEFATPLASAGSCALRQRLDFEYACCGMGHRSAFRVTTNSRPPWTEQSTKL